MTFKDRLEYVESSIKNYISTNWNTSDEFDVNASGLVFDAEYGNTFNIEKVLYTKGAWHVELEHGSSYYDKELFESLPIETQVGLMDFIINDRFSKIE